MNTLNKNSQKETDFPLSSESKDNQSFKELKKYALCERSPFPQILKVGKKYEILAKHKHLIAIIDETKNLCVYHSCYFIFI